MQLFPLVNTIVENAQNALSSTGDQSGGFENLLASYIEEGRYNYTGRPDGFSAYGPQSGTIDSETGTELGKELRRRNLREETVEKLEKLLASDSPSTIGTVFGALSGKGRYSDKLDDEQTTRFKTALAKLGFNKEEQDELTALGDEGDASAIMGRILNKLGSLEGTVEFTSKDWAALLRGLDASESAMTGLMAFFSNTDQLSVSGADLAEMLAGCRAEINEREAASGHAREAMREAMTQALAAAKMKKQSDPVADARGSRRSEQSEILMQDSVRKRTGMDDLAQEQEGETMLANRAGVEAGAEADPRDNPEDRKSGRNRSEHIPTAVGDTRAQNAEKPAQSVQAKVFANIAAMPDVQGAPQAGQSANTPPAAQNSRQEIFSQVEQGILQSALNGGQRLTLQLNPAELGQMTIVLSMHQGEVKATIRAENPDSADMLRAQLSELKTTLEAEGLKVKELDVQTGLSEQSLADRRDSYQEHNLMRDASQRDQMQRLGRIRREASESGNGVTLPEQAPAWFETGLHVVA